MRIAKSFSLTLLLASLLFPALAQIEVPRPSPAGSVSTVVGLTAVNVSYSRPKMNGRKIFGNGSGYVVPFGRIWRTGANLGTKISFSDDVTVQGVPVAKGSYLIFSWPDAKEWSIALYRDTTIGGDTGKYDKNQEAARFTVVPKKIKDRVETFTLNITDLSEDSRKANVEIVWENTSVKFSLLVDYDKRVMAAIERADFAKNPDLYLTAARYYYGQKRNLEQAVEWVNKYFEQPGKDGEFYNIYFRAQVYDALGAHEEAIDVAQHALSVAQSAPNDFGYIKLIRELIDKLNKVAERSAQTKQKGS